jgi:hypothetical protein
MVSKVKVGYLIPVAAQRQLRALAERDHRSLSGEVAWLVGREWRRHLLSLSPHHAQRLSCAGVEPGEARGCDGEL